ncbi:sortase SrtB family [Firmicutes bacterium CAG:170]|nr:sortase SrtB family [Firmicutes bacterium CAG:170]
MSSKAKKTILIAVAAVCILVCVGSGLFLYQYYHGVQVESTLLERMKTGTAEISSTPAPSDQPEQPEQDSGETPEESETDAAPSEEEPLMKTVRLPVDFAQLQAEAPDIYAWLELPDTGIDDPVLQRAGADLFYNSHNAYGQYYMCGAVFSQSAYNGRNFDSPMTVLYGHSTVLGQPGAFMELNNYADEAYFDAHREMRVYMPDGMYVYRIFAACVHSNEHLLYCHDFSDETQFDAFFSSLTEDTSPDSHIDAEALPQAGDKVLTLSTCYSANKNLRYLVMGVLEEFVPTAEAAGREAA